VLPHLLSRILDGAVAVVLWAALAALTVSVAAVIAGWGRRRDLLRRQGSPFIPARVQLGQAPFAAEFLDVAAEAASLLLRFEGLAARRFVALELAVQPALAVRADPPVLREVLGDLVERAIEQSPCGRVLLAAVHAGGRVQVTISNDGRQIDRAAWASRLRSAQRLAALQGATMDLDARPSGTTVVLRWPGGPGTQQIGAETAMPDPAGLWQAATPARESSNVTR
jgi:hypothetical protein